MSIDFPKEEEVVIQRWRDINAFHRQVRTYLLRPSPGCTDTREQSSSFHKADHTTPSTMALPSRPACLTTATCWHRQLKTLSRDTGP